MSVFLPSFLQSTTTRRATYGAVLWKNIEVRWDFMRLFLLTSEANLLCSHRVMESAKFASNTPRRAFSFSHLTTGKAVI